MIEPPIGSGGPAGTRWKNWSGDTWYQLQASLRHSCPVCVRRHGRILSRPWPTPFHLHCECTQLPILPGALAPMPFLGPEAIASLLTVAGRASLVGASNLLLREAGLVSWSDLFDGHGMPPSRTWSVARA